MTNDQRHLARRRVGNTLLSLCAAITGTACTSTLTSGEVTTASPAAPVSNTLPGPHRPPTHNNDGTSFDPCLAYTAEEIRDWGLDPSTVEDEGIGDTLQRGCSWKGEGWGLLQLILDRPVDDYLNQKHFPGSRRITVAGLGAVEWRDDVDPQRACDIEIPSQQSAVGTLVRVNDTHAEKVIPDACTKAMEIATVTATKLPK